MLFWYNIISKVSMMHLIQTKKDLRTKKKNLINISIGPSIF